MEITVKCDAKEAVILMNAPFVGVMTELKNQRIVPMGDFDKVANGTSKTVDDLPKAIKVLADLCSEREAQKGKKSYENMDD